jgi:hypothetical protein
MTLKIADRKLEDAIECALLSYGPVHARVSAGSAKEDRISVVPPVS